VFARNGGTLSILDFPQRRQQFFMIRRLIEWIDFREGNFSAFIHDERRPLADARYRRPIPKNSKRPCHFTMRIEIRAQRNLHHADFFLLPRNVTDDRVCAYVQDLGIKRGELLPVGVERRHLRGSSRCPVKRMKPDHHVLLASKIA